MEDGGPPALGAGCSESPEPVELAALDAGLPGQDVLGCRLLCGDGMAWLRALPPQSLHAVVTDPPYGLKEYEATQLAKRQAGHGGVWRIPPMLDGKPRSPLPRFTVLSAGERAALGGFFRELGGLLARALRPGGHVLLAGNAFLAQPVFAALVDGGLEYRGQLIRLVRTLRGGDRPKNAEAEFPDVTSLPRGCHEPWGLFRAPLPAGMTVAACLRRYGTGALRRMADGGPLPDVLQSERTPQRERRLAPHPSLKPQALLRVLVRAALPLGEGVLADPFAGSGSTLAAAAAQGVRAIGVERDPGYHALALAAIPRLAAV